LCLEVLPPMPLHVLPAHAAVRSRQGRCAATGDAAARLPAIRLPRLPLLLLLLLLLIIIIIIQLALPLLLTGVERLPPQLLAVAPEELDLEQVVAVVVGSDQGEPFVEQLALVDGETGELRGSDPSARDERAPPDQGHRRHCAGLPAPSADHLVAEVHP